MYLEVEHGLRITSRFFGGSPIYNRSQQRCVYPSDTHQVHYLVPLFVKEDLKKKRKRKRIKKIKRMQLESGGGKESTLTAEQISSARVNVSTESLMNMISPLVLLRGGWMPIVSRYLYERHKKIEQIEKEEGEERRGAGWIRVTRKY